MEKGKGEEGLRPGKIQLKTKIMARVRVEGKY